MAARFAEVVGVDVSPSMLAEAGRNAEHAGVRNVQFVLSDPELSRVRGPVDFVHSYITMQHIPPAIGLRLVDAMLERLSPDGSGMLHFVYARRAPFLRRAVHAMRRVAPPVNWAVNLAQGRRAFAPMMPMFEYPLPEVLERLDRAGCIELHGRLTDHGGHLGVMLFFTRAAPPLDAPA